jgi:hypothetical protein
MTSAGPRCRCAPTKPLRTPNAGRQTSRSLFITGLRNVQAMELHRPRHSVARVRARAPLMAKSLNAVLLAVALEAASTAIGLSAEPTRPTIFDIPLGALASDLPPPSEFGVFACGSNGGPPGTPILGWADFSTCAKDAGGWHEVYFEYDDEAEYVARAQSDYAAGWEAGTAIDFFPVITSVLFDDTGRTEALRIVTDPRPEQRRDQFLHLRPRQEHYLLALYLLDRFGMSASDCHDRPPTLGKSPMLGMFADQSCAATVAGRHYEIESRLYRRPGETDVDPATGMPTEGAFVSETRAAITATAAANKGTPPHPVPALR